MKHLVTDYLIIAMLMVGVLFMSCATSPLIRERISFCKKKCVIIESSTYEVPWFCWYITFGNYTVLKEMDGTLHKIGGKWGSRGDTVVVDVSLGL